MRWMALAMALLMPLQGVAQSYPWVTLSGSEITEILTDHTVDYPDAWQDFRASGRTLYNAGRDSWGYWAVRGDQYCSMWPPSDLWACYDMARKGDMVRFIGEAGDVTDGVLREAAE